MLIKKHRKRDILIKSTNPLYFRELACTFEKLTLIRLNRDFYDLNMKNYQTNIKTPLFLV